MDMFSLFSYYNCYCLFPIAVCLGGCLFTLFRIVQLPSTGKELSAQLFDFSVFYLIPSLVFAFPSRSVSWAECEIRFYWLLIIALSTALEIWNLVVSRYLTVDINVERIQMLLF